jgi:hypothetical protein
MQQKLFNVPPPWTPFISLLPRLAMVFLFNESFLLILFVFIVSSLDFYLYQSGRSRAAGATVRPVTGTSAFDPGDN